MTTSLTAHECIIDLREHRTAVWLRQDVASAEAVEDIISHFDVEAARARFARFAPLLSSLFPENGWDGRIISPLLDFPATDGKGIWLVKGDHALPMTGSIKARGGVHGLLSVIERLAEVWALPIDQLNTPSARARFAQETIVVASTGNLGFSVGVVARAIGLAAEIHMSADAKEWKKARLRELGAVLVEHDCDYSETISRARCSVLGRGNAMFIDDETSHDLIAGYAVAAQEVAEQIHGRGLVIDHNQLLVVYLPCGVGGAPGGIASGLKRIFGANVVIVFVEPVASPCMMVALATGESVAPSVYDYGCDNMTIADGLAVPRASQLVVSFVGQAIDAAVAVTDTAMRKWVGTAWRRQGLKLEPSAAAAFAAYEPFTLSVRAQPYWPSIDTAIHLFWATGGSKLPNEEFYALLSDMGEEGDVTT